MNSLQEILKSQQNLNRVMMSASSSTSIISLAEPIRKTNQNSVNLTGLKGIADIANKLAQRMNNYSHFTANIQSGINAQMSLELKNNKSVLSKLNLSFSQIAKQNKLVSDKLMGVASSQAILFKQLTEWANSNKSHLNKFNALGIALQQISTSYLKDVSEAEEWDDFDIADEANVKISKITEKAIINTTQITKNDLENFRTSIIEELSGLLIKSKTERARKFIMDLMTTIAFLLTFYGTYQTSRDITNKQVVIETKNELERLNINITSKIEEELNKFNKTRFAITNVNLRYSAKKNSKIIGRVSKEQIITIIEFRHKYLLISYIDKDTKEPKSGFVVKKYFKEKY